MTPSASLHKGFIIIAYSHDNGNYATEAVNLVYYPDYLEDFDWQCGGALITDRLVVTAAHCVQDDEEIKLTTIRLGEHDIRTNPDCQGKVCAPEIQDISVKKVWSHQNFNNPPFSNDVAIIELEKPALLHDYVSPICLPKDREQLSLLTPKDRVTVAGWGKTDMVTETRANILQVVQLPVLPGGKCAVFNKRFNWTEDTICAGGEKKKDACGGDSGGPVTNVYDTSEGPKQVLVGLVSFGPAMCGTGDLPGIYVSVPAFMKWILDHVEESSKFSNIKL